MGVGRVRASVRMEYDLSSSEEQQESFDPTKTAPLSMQRTEERSTTAAGGVAGTASNLPNGSGGATAKQSAEEGQNSRSENGTYAVSKLVRHTMVPAGRIKRVAAAVLVDDEVEAEERSGPDYARSGIIAPPNNSSKSRNSPRRRSAPTIRAATWLRCRTSDSSRRFERSRRR